MVSTGPSAADIQTHLYASFLQASTYDVALRVSGSWSAIYKLHRVVLIQSAGPLSASFDPHTYSFRSGVFQVALHWRFLRIGRQARYSSQWN